jgi:cell division protein FtsZ
VPGEQFGPPSGPPAEASPVTTPEVAAAWDADSPSYRPVPADRPAHAERPAHADGPGKTFDVATTRRRPVVFEEDDDLDVPDFLK